MFFKKKTTRLFSKAAIPFYIPISNAQGSPTLVIIHYFYSSHPSRYEVISHCGFDFMSLMTSQEYLHVIRDNALLL
jgi:hypothetical protein